MTDDNIGHEKPQIYINREVAKISTLSSGNIENISILEEKKYYLPMKFKW